MAQSHRGGPVCIRNDLVRGQPQRMWMTVHRHKLHLQTATTVIARLPLERVDIVVVPELPFSFVVYDRDEKKTATYFTFLDPRQRNTWLCVLQQARASITDRHGQTIDPRKLAAYATPDV